MRGIYERMRRGVPGRQSERWGEPIAAALRSLKTSFDSRYGGFGGAPKFPHPADFEFCLRRSSAAGHGAAERVATDTLERMALGGLYDQVGGGFSRYNVAPRGQIPHFQKMLYHHGPPPPPEFDPWSR